MRRISSVFVSVLIAFLLVLSVGAIVQSGRSTAKVQRAPAWTAGTAFTYQGYLTDGDSPADGAYDFIFTLYDDPVVGNQIGPTIVKDDLLVQDGLFTVELNFEPSTDIVFDGSALWLEITVRSGDNNMGPYSTLSPRQRLSPAPHAIYAARSDWQGLSGVPAGFADGLDDDTLAAITCTAGQIARWDGNGWVCSEVNGNISGVLAGTGLTGGGQTGEVTLELGIPYRLPQGCENGQIPAWTGSSWICSIDDVSTGGGGGDITGVIAGYGLEGGGEEGTVSLSVVSNTIQSRVADICPAGSFIQAINQDGTVVCDPDDDTIYVAGSGLGLEGITLAITSTYQLPQLCADGQIARWHASDQLWNCDADLDTTDDTVSFDEVATIVGTGPENLAAGDHNHSGLYAETEHNHDLRYFTQAELQNGTADVHWDSLANVPTGLEDGDDDTLASLICPDGLIAKRVGGAWECANDNDTTYTAGTGLSISNTTFAITGSYRLPQSCSNGQLASWNGSDWSCADPDSGAAGWALTGNAGTAPGSNFLGTTDAQPLELRVNGQRAFLLEPNVSSPNIVAGYGLNSVGGDTAGATVGGGGRELAINQASGDYSTVAGGAGNTTAGYAAAVGGGEGNSAGNSYTTISGGSGNTTGGNYATVSGGQTNLAGAVGVTIGGGQDNGATAPYAIVAGGTVNSATANYGSIGGGSYNIVAGPYGTIGGGGPADEGNPTTTNNRVYAGYGVVSGGGGNIAGDEEGDPSSSQGATVGGGIGNTADAAYASVGGGLSNVASGTGATVGGGSANSVTNNYAAVPGGQGNTASGAYASVGGGRMNVSSMRSAVVPGGEANLAEAPMATIGGGYGNQVTATFGTIPGGAQNHVGGSYGFAAGYRAQAEHQGTFVWSDSSGDFSSTAPDQFLIDADGGVGIGPNSPSHLLAISPTLRLLVDGNTEILGSELVTRSVFSGPSQFGLSYFGTPSDIDARGDTIYVTDSATNTLTIIDVSNPNLPTYVNHSTSGLHGPADVQVVGGLAFIASELNDSLVILDISDPTSGQFKAVGATNRNLDHPVAVTVSGNRAYVASMGSSGGVNSNLAVFDVADPGEILSRGVMTTGLEGASDIAVVADQAFVTSYYNDRLVIFDISKPDSILVKGFETDSTYLDGPRAVHVRGDYAYVVAENSNTLVVLDVSDPENIFQVGHALTVLTHPTSLFISGDYAYVAYEGEPATAEHSGLAVFDISDPADIRVMSVINMSNTLPFPEKPVAVHGNGKQLYVVNEGHRSIGIYDVSQLAAPAIRAGTLQADHLEAAGDADVLNNLSVGNGLNVGPGGVLIEGQLAVASHDDSYILGRLSLGAAGVVYSDTEKSQVTYPTQRLDVHGDARFRINDEHSLILSSPPEKGAFLDFTTNNFGAYYTPTARIEFSVPDPFTGTTHTTEVNISTQSASDNQIRDRMTIGEAIYFYNGADHSDLGTTATISFTKSGDVLPGFDNSYSLGDSNNRWAAVYAADGIIQTSDSRWKENILDLDVGLEEVKRLRPVTFSWIDDPDGGSHYGLVAQEVAEVLPAIVRGGEANQPLGLNYAEVVPILVSAVQEQQTQIDHQADQIAALRARLTDLENERDGPAKGPALSSHSDIFWLVGLAFLTTLVVVGRRSYGGRS